MNKRVKLIIMMPVIFGHKLTLIKIQGKMLQVYEK